MHKKNPRYSIIQSVVLVVCLMAGLVGCKGSDVPNSDVPAISGNQTSVTDNDQEESAIPSSPTPMPTDTPVPTPKPEYIDFAAQLKLDRTSGTLQTEATVKTFVDGDTVHFNVPLSVDDTGVLKARFLAVNTPESTGQIQEWGKAASKFTKEKLQTASSIILESDDGNLNADSTGGRYLLWIWYKPADSDEYRNLNLEILQNGYAIASNTGGNRYGTVAMQALANAKACKLHIFSGEKDPDFYYGDAYELTLKELRLNIAEYNGKRVAFEGVVSVNSDNTAYVEEYDPETDMYYGISIFYGYNLSGGGMEVLNVGNRVRIVGSCQFYEAGGTYQIADVVYKMMKPDDPGNIKKIGEGYSAAYVETSAETFVYGTVDILFEEENGDGTISTASATYPYAELAQGTTILMNDLDVKSIYTTTSDASSSKGAMTLTCETQDGITVSVRTVVLYDDNRKLITADRYEGCNISVKGLVEYYDGSYQIKVLSKDHITINH